MEQHPILLKAAIEAALLIGVWLATYRLSRGSAKEACRISALIAAGMFFAELMIWVLTRRSA